MSTPYDPELDPARESHRHDTESGSVGGEHRRPGHAQTEGEYEDRDVVPGETDTEAVGSYVDRDVVPGEQERPRDEGEYTDHDVDQEPPRPRQAPDEGEYTDVDPEEASHHRLTEGRDDTHG